LFVVLLAGIAVAIGYPRLIGRPVESPVAQLQTQPAVWLDNGLMNWREGEQTTGRFWLPLCDAIFPMCTAYVAGFVELHAGIHQSFCPPPEWRIAEAQALITKELRGLRKTAPELLDTRMIVIMLATFERELPCGRETNFG
jgi:hypothetical protein